MTATDPALVALVRARQADTALDNAFIGQVATDLMERARTNMEKAEELFAITEPTTSGGQVAKIDAVLSSLRMVREGDQLTPEGAHSLILHLESLRGSIAAS